MRPAVFRRRDQGRRAARRPFPSDRVPLLARDTGHARGRIDGDSVSDEEAPATLGAPATLAPVLPFERCEEPMSVERLRGTLAAFRTICRVFETRLAAALRAAERRDRRRRTG
jgi:hypothetical protein